MLCHRYFIGHIGSLALMYSSLHSQVGQVYLWWEASPYRFFLFCVCPAVIWATNHSLCGSVPVLWDPA